MLCLIFAVVMQAGSVNLGSAPSTVPAGKPQPPAFVQVPQIERVHTVTAPDLDPSTEETHAQMERDIGGHGEAIAGLKVEVENLEKLRQDPDRKDIEDLQKSRDHIEWTWGTIAAIITGAGAMFGAIIWKFGGRIWEEMVKPRIRRYLTAITQNAQ